jgi:hypothetical protein
MAQSGALTTLATQYQALEQAQLDAFYQDPVLTALRVELMQAQLLFLYGDPWFNYWSHDFNTIVQQMYTSHPGYATLLAFQQEVNAWTTPPDDPSLLAARYDARASLQALSAHVAQETLSFYAGWIQPLQELGALLAQHIQQIFGSADITAWYSDWASRWQQAFVSSAGYAALTQGYQRLFATFPAFHELLLLYQQLVDLLPSLNQHPAVEELRSLVAAVSTDPSVSVLANQYYQQLVEETNALLATTAYKAETERFLERLNGLMVNDPVSQLFTSAQYLAVQTLLSLRQSLHDAVANCLAVYGPFCDPYVDAGVLAWLPSTNGDSLHTVLAVGEFYDLHNTFWYLFYRSPAFLALQTESRVALETTLTPIIPLLLDAQARYLQNLRTIPQIAALQQAMANLTQALRAQPILAGSSQFATLGSLLDRIDELWRQLSGS